jgi:hypothetical protein
MTPQKLRSRTLNGQVVDRNFRGLACLNSSGELHLGADVVVADYSCDSLLRTCWSQFLPTRLLVRSTCEDGTSVSML